MHDIESESDIANLIDAFYRKVVIDPVIGFIFTDVVTLSWDEHIPIMNAFWGSILLGTSNYNRNPMIKHLELDKRISLVPVHFERWLELWRHTLRELFEGPIAEQAFARARHIAGVMQHKIEQTRLQNRPETFRLTE